MNKPPYCYDEINLISSGMYQQNIMCKDTMIYHYFRRKLFQRAQSVFKSTMPEHWAENYANACLWGIGYYAVINTNKFGVIPQWCTIGGYTVMYQPSYAIITNPAFNRTYNLTIDKQCVLIRLQPDYGGIMDTVNFHANMLALAAESVHVNLFNCHLAFMFASDDKADASTLKAAFDSVARGEPAVFVAKNKLYDSAGQKKWEKFDNDIGRTYISDKLLADMRTIINMFDTELGIPNNATPKKERQIEKEIDANNIETYTKMDMFLQSLKKECEKARNMFGIELDYNWRFPPITEGGEKSGTTDSVNTGNV